MTNGVTHSADAIALQAQADLTAAYNDAAGAFGALLLRVAAGRFRYRRQH